MASARKKVIKEVLDSSIRDMLEKHLARRFKLFTEGSLSFTTVEESGDHTTWGIGDLEGIWKARHQIVHEGKLDVDRNEFERALIGCSWIETFLSLQARDTYGLSVDSPSKLDVCAPYYTTTHQYVLFCLQVGWALTGFLSEMAMRKR